VIEHVFALAVALEIAGHRREQAAVGAFEHQRRALPAGAGADAARILERGEEGVADEGIAAAGERVPFGLRERADRGAERSGNLVGRHHR